MPSSRRAVALAAIALAILFNVPYSLLAVTFEYPDVLRRPPGEVLDLFAAGGAGLVLTWHAFMLSALALVPVAIALSLTRGRVASHPGLAVGAAISGSLAGLAQAIGLSRWVFVIPELARQHADPAATESVRLAAEQAFAMLNGYGGVASGEHLGQWLTALFVAQLAMLQWRERRAATASIGFVTAAAIAIGTTEGVALAIGASGEAFSLFTIGGFLGLSAWLIATGLGEWQSGGTSPPVPAPPATDQSVPRPRARITARPEATTSTAPTTNGAGREMA
jgi:Domain of unknown function (DUF4386)